MHGSINNQGNLNVFDMEGNPKKRTYIDLEQLKLKIESMRVNNDELYNYDEEQAYSKAIQDVLNNLNTL